MGFFLCLMVSVCWLGLRAELLEPSAGFEGKLSSLRRRGWCPCIHINTGNYMIAGGVCTAAFSLFWFVYFYHSKVGPLICSCGLCCTQEAASALFSRVSFTCAAPRREAHHLQSKHPFSLMQCCCLYGQIAHVSKGRQHTVAHFHLFCIVHVLLCICLNVICFTFALMCWL